MKKYDLEDRLVDFSARIIDVVEALPNSRAGMEKPNQQSLLKTLFTN